MWWVTLGCILLVLAVLVKSANERYPNQPPGPIGLPFVGHLLFLGTNPLKTFLGWKKKYGAIFFIKFGSWDMVVLNDAKVIREGFAQKALSGRSLIPCLLSPNGNGIVNADGPKTFQMRKVMFAYLKEHFAKYEPLLQDVAQEAVKDLTRHGNQPRSIEHCFDVPQFNLLWQIVFGKESLPDETVVLHLLQKLKKAMEIPNVWTLASMFLTWTRPLIPERLTPNVLRECNEAVISVISDKIQEFKASHVLYQPRGFVDTFFDQAEKEKANTDSWYHDKDHLAESLSDLFIAGLETTGSTIEWAIFYLAGRPEVQRKLQEEIDLVVGPSRNVSLDDKPNMPYVDAVIQETLRRSSIIALGGFHRAIENTKLGGFSIKKDQLVLGHIYGVHLDPDVWENPSSFQPERFLEGGSSFKKLDDIVAFPPGRRSCVGESAGRNELFVVLVTIYKYLDIQLAGPVGKDRPFGFTLRAPEFKVVVKRRNASISSL